MAVFSAVWEKIDVVAILNIVMQSTVSYLPRLAAAVAVLAAFWLFLLIAKRVLRPYMRGMGMPEPIQYLVVTLLKYALVIVGLIAAADQLNIRVGSLIAGVGLAGLAVSFAAQDTIANIISGITLITDKPFTVGDWVEVDGVNAHVTKILLRTTTLTTLDNQTIVVPNKILAQQRIINYTLTPRIRVRVPVGIAYKENIQAARQAMLATLEGDTEVMAEPQPQVIVTGLGASSVQMELRFWVQDAARQLPKQWEYVEKCKYALDGADIEIPFPHLQLFLEHSAGLAGLTDALARS